MIKHYAKAGVPATITYGRRSIKGRDILINIGCLIKILFISYFTNNKLYSPGPRTVREFVTAPLIGGRLKEAGSTVFPFLKRR